MVKKPNTQLTAPDKKKCITFENSNLTYTVTHTRMDSVFSWDTKHDRGALIHWFPFSHNYKVAKYDKTRLKRYHILKILIDSTKNKQNLTRTRILHVAPCFVG